MIRSFNLIKKPFIPCVDLNGEMQELSFQEALAQAHSIKRIQSPSPLITIGLHRVLLAILHAAFRGPSSQKQWLEWWKAKNWPTEKLEAYVIKFHDRFDLFDKDRPFLQWRGFEAREKSGVNKLATEIAGTNVKPMFSHVSDDDPPVLGDAEVARQLIAHQYTTGQGGRGYGGSPLSRGAVVLAEGNNLFETLLLNLMTYKVGDNRHVQILESDCPAWESNANPSEESRIPNGLLDLYTWQSRSVRLIPDDKGEGVQWMYYGPGRMFQPTTTIYDPAVAFRETNKGEIRAIGFDLHKMLWRDLSALLEFGGEDRHRRPAWMEQLSIARHNSADLNLRRVGVVALGYVADSAKVFLWRHETFSLPLAYLEDFSLVEKLKLALTLAESVGSTLYSAAKKTIESRLSGNSDGKPDSKRVTAMLDSFAPQPLYWSRLELPYRTLLEALAEENADRDKLLAEWFDNILKPSAINAFDQSIGRIDGGRDLKAAVVGRGWLSIWLAKIRKDQKVIELQPQETGEAS